MSENAWVECPWQRTQYGKSLGEQWKLGGMGPVTVLPRDMGHFSILGVTPEGLSLLCRGSSVERTGQQGGKDRGVLWIWPGYSAPDC